MFGMKKTIWCWASDWTIKLQKHNINTQGAKWDLLLMFGLDNELEHFYKNRSLKI
jgi:hypothetical protein